MKIRLLSAAMLSFSLYTGATLHAQDVIVPGAQEPVDTETVGAARDLHGPAITAGVRIVRLSQVNGVVKLDRNTNNGFEPAFPNLPVVEGQKLLTGEGVAEVEFEDNSTLRVTPDSFIEFPDLKRASSGETSSRVLLRGGTLYVSLAKTKAEDFKVTVGKRTFVLAPSSHIRLDVNGPTSKLTVFSGDVRVDDGASSSMVGKKKAVTFSTATPTATLVASDTEDGPFDKWDKKSAEYHSLRSVPAAVGGLGYAYGANDLSYYGSFVDGAGCGGTMWRPYLSSAAWNPYGNGLWAWYPGSGYSWVSAYPWGWTPFHSGSWAFCQSAGGWGWRPGGAWRGLRNSPTNLNPGRGPGHTPGSGSGGNGPICPKPPGPPSAGQATLHVANAQPLSVSRLTSGDTLEFRKDSAGLGVPRGGVGSLSKISNQVAQHGFASKTVQPTAFPGPGGAQALTAGNQRGNTAEHNGATASRSANSTSRGATATTGSAAHAGSTSSAGSMSAGGHASGAGGGSTAASSGSSGAGSAPSSAGGGGHH